MVWGNPNLGFLSVVACDLVLFSILLFKIPKRLERYQESSVLHYQLLVLGLQAMVPVRFIQCEEDKACQSPIRDSNLPLYSIPVAASTCSSVVVAVTAATCVLAIALCILVFHKWNNWEKVSLYKERSQKKLG